MYHAIMEATCILLSVGTPRKCVGCGALVVNVRDTDGHPLVLDFAADPDGPYVVVNEFDGVAIVARVRIALSSEPRYCTHRADCVD